VKRRRCSPLPTLEPHTAAYISPSITPVTPVTSFNPPSGAFIVNIPNKSRSKVWGKSLEVSTIITVNFITAIIFGIQHHGKWGTLFFIGAVEGTFIIAIFLATVIMLTSRAIKIKKRMKSINWRNIQQKANNVVNILTSLLYIILFYQAIQNKFFEIKVSLTFLLIYLSYNKLYNCINLIIKIYFRWRQTATLIQITQLFRLQV
jgi:hypothetical protein